MKTIVLKKYLPRCITHATSQEETIKNALLRPLIHKPQGNKASSTKSLLKKTDETKTLNIFDLPNYLTLLNTDDVQLVGIPAFFTKEISESLDENDIKSIKSQFKEHKMHCILPNFANFKSKNFDAYGMQRMNNIFNYQQWNDMYKRYKDDYNYKDYLTLNKIFAEEICNLYEDGDCIVILEHDLWMTAGMIREKIGDAKIGILCLQPMPNLESFKTFFNPNALIESMLNVNIIEFQSDTDLSKFVLSASVIASASYKTETLEDSSIKKYLMHESKDVVLSVNKFKPDTSKINDLIKTESCQQKIKYFGEKYKNKKVIITVASHINNSTITDVLMGIEAYLHKYGNGIALVVVEVSEGKINFEVKQENHRMVEYINITNTSSIVETYAPTDDSTYYALLQTADLALILTERSAFSKPALEYLAVQKDKGGRLITSKFATFSEHIDVIKVNPKDTLEIATAIRSELYPNEMKTEHKKIELQKLYCISDFVEKMKIFAKKSSNIKEDFTNLKKRYEMAKRRLFCLDYDGTLTKIVPNPPDAKPDQEITEILLNLAKNDKNNVCICTGRGRDNINEWMPDKNIQLFAEHGQSKRFDGEWVIEKFDIDWKDSAKQILQFFVERTPGSHIEEKVNGFAYHVRQADVKVQEVQVKALKGILMKTFKHRKDVKVMDGKCVLEIKSGLMDKGRALKKLEETEYDFIFVAGDDKTDEDMFRNGINNSKVNTVVVGNHKTCAKYKVENVDEMRKLLTELSNVQ